MNPRISGWKLGLICTALAVAAVAQADPQPPSQVPDYYVGVGGRGLKGEPFATVIGAKIKLMDLDGLTFSTRPALLFGAYDDEWSLQFTVEGKVNEHGFAWFGGGGLTHGMDNLGDTDPSVTGGIELPFSDRLVLSVQINYMWQDTIEDLDGELLVSINYGF